MEKLWRVRKKVAVNQENLNDELFLTNLSLQIAPKCAETWAYRRFLFRSSAHIDSLLVTSEWDLIYTTGKLHKCNYFTWEHARWLYRFRKEEFDLNRFIKFLKQNVSD